MGCSILDVAREANVAPSTVSLVVNGRTNVSEETRRHVKATIKRLRYRPRRAKRVSRIAVVYTQNLIVNGALAQYCRQWIAGIQEGVLPQNAHVSVYAGYSHVDQDLVFTQSLQHRECDGVILMGVYPKHGYIDHVLASGLPLVVMDRPPAHTEFSAVCVDHYDLGRQVARRLCSLGHRKLAILTGVKEHFPAKAVRAGFTQELANTDAEIVFDVQSPSGQLSDEYFGGQLEAMLNAGATAVFTGDPAALRLANAMEERQLPVGERLSVIGFDHMGLATRKGKRISTMGYDKHVMGLLAGRIIQQLIQMGEQISHQFVTVPSHFVEGDTLGRPA